MSDELKPCPFCGNSAVLVNKDGIIDDPLEWVSCIEDSCMPVPIRFSKGAWNTRPIEDVLTAERDAARAEVERMREAQRWIPVEERLPNEGELCLINIKSRISNAVILRMAVIQKFDAGEYDWKDPQDNYVWGGNITHWMPLPEPPSLEVKP